MQVTDESSVHVVTKDLHLLSYLPLRLPVQAHPSYVHRRRDRYLMDPQRRSWNQSKLGKVCRGRIRHFQMV